MTAPAQRAFTLLELVVAMVVISIISAAVAPVIFSATDAYAAARDARATADDAAFATAALVRLIQEAPAGEGARLGVADADGQSILFTDGSGVRLDAETLVLLTAEGEGPLARGVRDFRLEYLGPDGRTPATPQDAHRVHITLTIERFTTAAAAFPRINTGEDL